jgi:endoglucanase
MLRSLPFLFMLYCTCGYAQDCVTPVELHGALSVSGTKIVNSASEPVALAGNSFFWSNDGWGGEAFYTSSTVEYLTEQWQTSIIRIAMGVEDTGGYISSPTSNLAKVKTLIDAGIAQGRYVIVDWHSHNAEAYQAQAVAFFTEIAQTYGHHSNIIYEIYNEPLNVSWTSVIKPYAQTVIDAIRAVDPDNLILVGTPNWSQDVDVASQNPITGETNIAYVVHFYAGTHGASLRQKCQTAINNGIALFCTEWGSVNADGNGSVAATSTMEWMDFFETNQISHCNWSVNNKAEGASIFLSTTSATGTWTDSNLTDSGILVKSILLDWAIPCDGTPQLAWVSHATTPTTGAVSVTSEWIEGGTGWFNGNIVITNNSSTTIDGYTLSFAAPFTITSMWNDLTATLTNGVYTITVGQSNFDWLRQIAPNQSVNLGFTASGSFAVVTNILWNGAPLETGNEEEIYTFTEWAATHGVSGSETDSDGDGFSNLLEFLLATTPDDQSSIPQIKSSLYSTGGQNYFQVEFSVDPAAQDVEYRLQVSSELAAWSAIDGAGGMEFMSASEQTNGLLLVKWKSHLPLLDASMPANYFTRIEAR